VSQHPGVPNAAIHPPGDNYIVRQVLDERQADSGRVQSLVRPPPGCGTSASSILSACFVSQQQAVSNARINPPPDDTIQRERNHRTMMKGKLRAVGLNELLGAVLFIQDHLLREYSYQLHENL
jgi:hypothetical protein